LAGRLAEDRYQLDPSDRGAARRAVLLALDGGADVDLEAQPVSLSEVLNEALDRQLHTAARRCCEALGQQRDPSAVASPAGQTAPLVRALDAVHPAVRFAAAQAIVSIDPRQAYAGSSRLIIALDHFAGSSG
ncbi:unnamed protein product, partial [Ectocarpus sp. 4 AP-2014]